MLTSTASCTGNNVKNWLLSPGTSSQGEEYSSKWLIWLVCGEPLLTLHGLFALLLLLSNEHGHLLQIMNISADIVQKYFILVTFAVFLIFTANDTYIFMDRQIINNLHHSFVACAYYNYVHVATMRYLTFLAQAWYPVL